MKSGSVGDRMRERRKELGMSQLELAERSGLSQPTISALERGTTSKTGSVASVADALRVNALWLQTGRGSPKTPTLQGVAKQAQVSVVDATGRKDDEPIEIVATRGSCGGADGGKRDVDEIAASVYPIRKDQTFYTNAGVEPGDVKAIIADGDGMERFIVHGDTVFVATTHCDRLQNGLIYAIETPNGIMIRRAFVLPDGRVILSYDHPDKSRFRDVEYSAEDAAQITIFGRFLYRQG